MAAQKKISRERVLRAALRIADKQGVEAVTMRRVGEALGVEAMALYKHLANKAAILDGIAEAVLAEVDVPADSNDPAQALATAARSFRHAASRHPRVFPLIAVRPVRGPIGLHLIEQIAQVLLAAGLTPRAAVEAYRVIDAYLIGFALLDVARQDRGARAPSLRGLAALQRFAEASRDLDTDRLFDEGLDLLLRALLPPGARRPGP